MDRLLGSEVKGFLDVGRRVAIDQLTFAPIGLLMFCAYNGAADVLLKSASEPSLDEIKRGITNRIEANYIETLKNNWKVWPGVQAVNFAFIPLQYRYLFSSTFSIAWNVYMSLLVGAPPKTIRNKKEEIVNPITVHN